MGHGNWVDEIPTLGSLDEETKARLRRAAARVVLPPDKVVFRPGDECMQFPLILSGSIRVQRVTESGREIVLYRVTAHETCILTIASLLASETYLAEGITETEVVAYILRAAPFRELMNSSASFRSLVFEGYSRRITMLMSKIEELLCTRIDVRLAERLLALMDDNHHIAVTQHALAADLGTAREVVGRTLNGFVKSGWVSLSRGAIDIADPAALAALVGGNRS
jgi:CRP/FNR family transcriptional regulator, anaerobic regulatory protein